MAEETFSAFITGAPPITTPVAGDLFPLVRNGITYQVPGTFPSRIYGTAYNLYSAQDYGGTWDGASGHDVGPAINLAIAAAAAAGGGTVIIPAGTYYLATQIRQSTSGVRLLGAGLGAPRDTTDSTHFLAYTRLIWNGTAGATMCDVEPVAGGSTQSLYDCGVEDILFDCAVTAGIGIKIAQVSWSRIRVGAAEPRSIGILLTTIVTSDSPGSQRNEIWLYSRCTIASDAYHPTGIMIDSGAGSSWNVSVNRFYDIFAWYNSGDGIVIGNSDNDLFFDLSTYPEPSVSNGNPCVIANSLYVSPNGVAVHGAANTHLIFRAGTAITVKGTAGGATPATSIRIEWVDKGNSVPDPVFDTGATGSFATSTNPYPTEMPQGTFTPGIGFGNPPLSVGVTYGARSGKITKIGRLNILEGSLTLTNKGSSTGRATILTGVVPLSDLVLTGMCSIPYYAGMTSITSFVAYIPANFNGIVLNKPDVSSVTEYDQTNFTNTTRIDFVAMFFSQ